MRKIHLYSAILASSPFLTSSCSERKPAEPNQPKTKEKIVEGSDLLIFKDDKKEKQLTPPVPTPALIPEKTTDNLSHPPNDTPTSDGYPIAKPVPGKEGFVYNPFTKNIVDLRGIPSGTLVRDPLDTNKNHIFRAP